MKERIRRIQQEIGNNKTVAVSKGHSVEKIEKALNAGITMIGENKIQEAEEKYRKLKDLFNDMRVEFHLIGHLQKNKVKKAVMMFDMIQSVDSLKIAQEIDKRAKEIGKVQLILIQINIGAEKQKHGVMPEEIFGLLEEISKLENISVKGLMCITPYFEDAEKTRPYFRMMKSIFDKTGLEILSMGMSHDYKIAVEEGSNMIRIGTKIFGERIK
jgi:PLP dependent protein